MPQPPVVAVEETASSKDAEGALGALGHVDARLSELLKPLVAELQTTLSALEGKSFGFELNKKVIDAIQTQLQRLGMRVCCPRCSAAAIPRCRATASAKDGSFQFEHYQEGKQTNHGGGTTFPVLKLIPAPPDQRRTRKKRKKA
ncbi:hypothetical protein BH10PLA2_BH10PLA2_23450 [soil metagenome]